MFDGKVDNDKTLELLQDQALLLAQSGADVLAPSDMMDGRVRVIRNVLESNGFVDTIILSYAAKYASSFYGPFREAVGSLQILARLQRNHHEFCNPDEALHETAMDIEEGADIVMLSLHSIS